MLPTTTTMTTTTSTTMTTITSTTTYIGSKLSGRVSTRHFERIHDEMSILRHLAPIFFQTKLLLGMFWYVSLARFPYVAFVENHSDNQGHCQMRRNSQLSRHLGMYFGVKLISTNLQMCKMTAIVIPSKLKQQINQSGLAKRIIGESKPNLRFSN